MTTAQLIPRMWILMSLLISVQCLAQNRIVQYEYWYNNDAVNRVSTTLSTPVELFELNTAVPSHGLSFGINTFNIRFKDNSKLWSGVLSEFFYKAPPGMAANREIVAYEYWYNNDAGSRILQTVASTGQLNLVTGLNAAMLQNGINTFNIRFKDNTGLWSGVLSEFFYKAPPGLAANREIVAYEYWYNNDVSSRILQTVASTGQLNLVTGLNAALLQNGINTFNIRFKDNTGLWSSVMSEFFYKSPLPLQQGGNQQEENLMAAWEFWFEDSQGNQLNQKGEPGTTLVVPGEPINPLVLNLNLDMRQISRGTYQLMFRFFDTRGLWSAALAQEVVKTPYPWPLFVSPQTTFCGAGTVAFDNFSIDADTWLWDFGDGTTSTLPEPQHTYAQPGIYTVRLTAVWSATGQSNTLVMDSLIVVHALPQPSFLYQVDGSMVVFENTSQGAQSYHWDFGDGNQSSENNPQHIYGVAGPYQVCLTAFAGVFCPTIVVCDTLKITTSVGSALAQQELKAYPVPFDASLMVAPDPAILWQSLEIYGASGQLVLRLPMHNPVYPVRLDTSQWSPGVYTLILYASDGHIVRLKALKK